MLNHRSLSVLVGSLSLALGLWALLGDVPALGMAAGAVGFVAGLIGLLPRSTTDQDEHLVPTENASTPPPAVADITDRPSSSITSEPRALPTAPPTGRAPARLPGASLSDAPSGLFSEDYLEVALDSRLASARRHLRPVALAMFQVTEGLPDEARSGTRALVDRQGTADPSTVGDAIRRTIRDSDIACRLRNGSYAVILEDTPESGAVWTVERIRRNLVGTAGHHTMWAGVACYPAHAFDAPEMRAQVETALMAAQEWNQDRIEVAASD